MNAPETPLATPLQSRVPAIEALLARKDLNATTRMLLEMAIHHQRHAESGAVGDPPKTDPLIFERGTCEVTDHGQGETDPFWMQQAGGMGGGHGWEVMG